MLTGLHNGDDVHLQLTLDQAEYSRRSYLKCHTDLYHFNINPMTRPNETANHATAMVRYNHESVFKCFNKETNLALTDTIY